MILVILLQKSSYGLLPLETLLQESMKPVQPVLALIDLYEEIGLLEECQENPLHLACSHSAQEIIERMARLPQAKEWAATLYRGSYPALALLRRIAIESSGATKDISSIVALTPEECLISPCPLSGETPLHLAAERLQHVGPLVEKLPFFSSLHALN